jgi:uncharacterized membrane-anchored protein YitT (DUF2179 family)
MMRRAWTAVLRLRCALPDFLLVTAGGLVLIANLHLFLIPSDIAPGGVSGTAIILNHFTGWPVGLTMLALNLPMVVLGFRTLGRFRFLVRTLYVVILYNVGADLVVRWISFPTLSDDLLLNALFAGVLGGIGSGLVYRGGGTLAGTGVLGRILQIRTGIPVSQLYLLTDGGVILAAGLVFGWEKGLYALITLFLWGLTTDFVLEGPSVVRMAFIVTDAPDKVADAVFEELHLGVTAWPAEGMFTEVQHAVLFCTVSRPQARALQRVVTAADPTAFLVVGQGHQASGGVFGQPWRRMSGKEKPSNCK